LYCKWTSCWLVHLSLLELLIISAYGKQPIMSEYQYYEFQAIDRPLTEKEQSYIASLSRRVALSPNRAIFTYSFGDLPAKPRSILQNYFDAMLYLANWGTKQLAFRLPRSVVDPEMIEPYCFGDVISAYVTKRDILLDICVFDEENIFWVEGEGWLPSLALLRQDILRGDFRALYLAWLKAISFEQDIEDAEEQLEPPVPANLQTLSSPLKKLIELFELDEDLIAAASESSPHNEGVAEGDIEELIAKLSEQERNNFLVKLAKGEANVEAQLVNKLRDLSSNKAGKGPIPRLRSVAELLVAAREKTKQRKEKQRQEAERAKIRRLRKLKDKEPQVWEEIFTLIEKKQSKAYDEATKLLVELRELANYLGEPDKFKDRVNTIFEKYHNRPGLKSRLQQADLLNPGEV
jgi:hypothetical protein